MGDTLYGYVPNYLNMLVQARMPQALALGGNPFNAAGVAGLPGTPSGPGVVPTTGGWGGLGGRGWGMNAPPAVAAPVAPPAAAVPAVPSPMASGWGAAGPAIANWYQQMLARRAMGATPPAFNTMPPDYGNVGIGTAAFDPTAQATLNQVNPNVQAYGGQPGYAGAPGTQGGAAGAGPMPSPSQPSQSQRLASQAAAYRRAHAPQTAPQQGLTADQLNALSLAAARAGRTYFNPALNVQPGGNVVNALVQPSGYMLPPQAAATGYMLRPQQGGQWS